MKLYRGVLPLVIGNFAKNFGVQLYMYGKQAFTDGKSITIPHLDLNDPVSMEMAYGYVAHECAHIRFSDWDCLRTMDHEDFILHDIFNALEDCRIEYLQTCDWPGLATTFDFLLRQVSPDSKRFITRATNSKNFVYVAIFYAMFHLRLHELEQEHANEVFEKTKSELLKVFPSSFLTGLNKLIAGVSKLPTSYEVLACSHKVKNYLLAFLNSSAQEGELLDLENQQHYLVDSIRNQFADTLGENFADTIANEVANGSDAFLKHGCIRPTKSPNMPSLASRLCKNSNNDNSQDYGSANTGYAKPRTNSDLLTRVKAQSHFMRSVSDLIRGYEDRNIQIGESGRLLDCRRYNLFTEGLTTNVFKRAKAVKALNTHIHTLVDISGSMSCRCTGDNEHRERYQIANEVALSLALALRGRRHIQSDVTYFPGAICEYDVVAKHGQNIISRAAYFDQIPRGSTPLTQALHYAVEQFKEVGKYQRDIILVITDGDPDNPDSVQKLLHDIEQCGVEVYVIKIGETRNERAQAIFPRLTTLSDASELSSALVKLLGNALFNNKTAFHA